MPSENVKWKRESIIMTWTEVEFFHADLGDWIYNDRYEKEMIQIMKNYFKQLFNYHKKRFILYILLISIISVRYYFKIPTPFGFVLKPLHIHYWSEGLTTAFLQLIKGNFYRAYKINPLIFIVVIVIFFHIFLEPIIFKNSKTKKQ